MSRGRLIVVVALLLVGAGLFFYMGGAGDGPGADPGAGEGGSLLAASSSGSYPLDGRWMACALDRASQRLIVLEFSGATLTEYAREADLSWDEARCRQAAGTELAEFSRGEKRIRWDGGKNFDIPVAGGPGHLPERVVVKAGYLTAAGAVEETEPAYFYVDDSEPGKAVLYMGNNQVGLYAYRGYEKLP